MGGGMMNSEITRARPAPELNITCSCLDCESQSCFQRQDRPVKICLRCKLRDQKPLEHKSSASTSNPRLIARSELNFELERELLIKINNLKSNKSSHKVKTLSTAAQPKTLSEYTDSLSGNPIGNKQTNLLEDYILHLKEVKLSKAVQCFCVEDENDTKTGIIKGSNENDCKHVANSGGEGLVKSKPTCKKKDSQHSLKVCNTCKVMLDNLIDNKHDETSGAVYDAVINTCKHVNVSKYISIRNPEVIRKVKELTDLNLIQEKPTCTSETHTTQKKRNMINVRNVITSTLPSPFTNYNLKSISSKDYNNSISLTVSSNSLKSNTLESNTLESKSIYSSFKDTIKKIKEAYKICSCKVCECTTKKSIENNQCECEPCQCLECRSYMTGKENISVNDTYYYCDLDHPYTPFCTKSKIRTQKKQKNYSADDSKCSYCPIKDSDKDCNCEMCECIECEVNKEPFFKTKVVTPFVLDQHTACQCTPCECIVCNPGYNYVSENLNVHESKCKYSPGKSRGNINSDKVAISTCKKVTDTSEVIDMQTNTMIHDVYSLNKLNDHRMLALYASLPPMCVNYGSSNTNKGAKTDGYEGCTSTTNVSMEKETENSVLSHYEEESEMSYKFTELPSNNIWNRNLSENQICTGSRFKNKSPKQIGTKPIKCVENYVSNECSDVYLDNIPDSTKLNYKYMLSYKRRIDDSSSRISRPIKKGEVLTPSAHQTKIQKLMLAKGLLPRTLTNKKTLLDKYSSYNSEQDDDTNKNVSKPDNNISMCERTLSLDKNKVNENKTDAGSELNDFYPGNDIMKGDANMEDQEYNKLEPSPQNNFIHKSSPDYTSHAVSKSLFKRNHNVCTNHTYINKSLERSCNSSGNEPPNYLIRFPKSSSCFDKVLQAIFDHNLDLENIDVCLEHKYMLSEGKEKYLRTCRSNCLDTKTISTEIKSSVNLYKNNENRIEISRMCHKPQKFYKVCEHHNVKQNINTIYNNDDATKSCCQKLSSEREHNSTRDINSWTSSKIQSFACSDHKVDIINRDENYEGVYKTLKEAKEFSSHLLNLLAIYEKANANFEKTTDKLEIPSKKSDKESNADTTNINTIHHLKEALVLSPDVLHEQNIRDYHESSSNFDLNQCNPYKSSTSLNTDRTIGKRNQLKENKKEDTCNSICKAEKPYRDSSTNYQNVLLDVRVKDIEIRRNNDDVKRSKSYKKFLRKPYVKKDYTTIIDSKYSTKCVLSEGQIFSTPFQNYANVKPFQLDQESRSKQVMTNLSPSYRVEMLSSCQIDKQDSSKIVKFKLKSKGESTKKIDKQTSPKPIYVDKEVLYNSETHVLLVDGRKV